MQVWKQDDVDQRMWSISTEPKFGIGQRCILLETSDGNVLWDCIAYLDDETVDAIKGRGGLKAIVISHPHYYTTHLDWAEAFDCPVYIAAEDEEWLSRNDASGRRKLINGTHEEILPGVIAAKPGGHFPGSLVMCWDSKLFIADTLVTTPSAYYHIDRPAGTTSYAFMWSIPNMIPLPPGEMFRKYWRQ
jgi:glyoxylase-like metal-dependent hydrolase (beta-lactamase superfamily II)